MLPRHAVFGNYFDVCDSNWLCYKPCFIVVTIFVTLLLNISV